MRQLRALAVVLVVLVALAGTSCYRQPGSKEGTDGKALEGEAVHLPGEVLDISVAAAIDRFAVSCASPQAGAFIYDFGGRSHWSVAAGVLVSRSAGRRPVPGELLESNWSTAGRFTFNEVELAADAQSIWFEQNGVRHRATPGSCLDSTFWGVDWWVTASGDRMLIHDGGEDWRVWSSERGLPFCVDQATAAALLPQDAGWVLGYDGAVTAYADLRRELWGAHLWTGPGPDALYVAPSGDIVLAVDRSRGLVVAVRSGGEQAWTYQGCPTDARFSPDGTRVVLSFADARLVCLNSATGAESGVVVGAGGVLDVSKDGLVLAEVAAHAGGATTLAIFRPDGSKLGTLVVPEGKPEGKPEGGFNPPGDALVVAVPRSGSGPGADTVHIFHVPAE